MKVAENDVWTLLETDDVFLTPREYSAGLQCAESDSPSVTAADYEDLQRENTRALYELQQLEKEIEAEKREGQADMIQMDLDVAKKFLDESDNLKVEADYLQVETSVMQQQRAFEGFLANMAQIMEDERLREKQWYDDFEEEIGEETLKGFEIERILQIETEEVLKECDQHHARTKELRKESERIQTLTDRRARELLRGVEALNAESEKRRTMKQPKQAPEKMQKAKAMVQAEAQHLLKAKLSISRQKLMQKAEAQHFLKAKHPNSQARSHQPTLPVLLGRAGFVGRERDLPPHKKPAMGSIKKV